MEATPTPTATPTPDMGAMQGVEKSLSLVERPAVGVPPMTMGIDPARLELMEDQPVKLTVTNAGQASHSLTIEGLDVATDTIGPGESVIVEFVPQEKGTYKMLCPIGGSSPAGHEMQGMVGEVVVA